MNAFEELRKYKELLDKEVITQEEFEIVKADLLGLSGTAAAKSAGKTEKQESVADQKAQKRIEDEKRIAEEMAERRAAEEKKLAEEVAAKRAAEEKKLAEEVAAKRAAEEKKLAETVAARKRAEEESKFAEEMAKKRAEEEAKLAEEIERKRKEEEAKIAEEMTQKRAEAEEKLLSEMPEKGDEVSSPMTGTQRASSNQTKDMSSTNEKDDSNNSIKATDEVKKEDNEIEKNDKLSKSMPEEGGGQKKKSKAPVIIIGVVVLVALVVGAIVINNSKEVQQEAPKPDTINEDNVADEEGTTGDSSDEPEKTGPAKKAEVGETVKAETKYGDFEVAAISAARTNWYDGFNEGNEDSECIVVRFEINNIDYVGEYDEGYLNGYILSGNGHLTVLDEDGFKTAFFDIAGPTDGQWAVAKDTNVGEKARVSYTYIVPKGTKKVTVNVNGQYEIPVELDEEVVKQ